MTALSADLTTIALLQALAGLNMNEPLEHRSILDMTTINDVPGEKYVRRDGSLILKFGNPVEGPHEQFDFYGSEALADRIVTAVNAFEANQARIAELEARLRDAIRIADEAAEEWDKAPSGMRAGKILLALAGHVPGYRADTDAVHAALSIPS